MAFWVLLSILAFAESSLLNLVDVIVKCNCFQTDVNIQNHITSLDTWKMQKNVYIICKKEIYNAFLFCVLQIDFLQQ